MPMNKYVQLLILLLVQLNHIRDLFIVQKYCAIELIYRISSIKLDDNKDDRQYYYYYHHCRPLSIMNEKYFSIEKKAKQKVVIS